MSNITAAPFASASKRKPRLDERGLHGCGYTVEDYFYVALTKHQPRRGVPAPRKKSPAVASEAGDDKGDN